MLAKEALDRVTPEVPLAKQVARDLLVTTPGGKDVLAIVGGGHDLHMKPEDQTWATVTACGKKIVKELSVLQTLEADMQLICLACCSARSVDDWMAAATELC